MRYDLCDVCDQRKARCTASWLSKWTIANNAGAALAIAIGIHPNEDESTLLAKFQAYKHNAHEYGQYSVMCVVSTGWRYVFYRYLVGTILALCLCGMCTN